MESNKYFNFDWGFLKMDEEKVYPSCEALYGPYETVDKAYESITSQIGAENIPLGLTVGISVEDDVVEYWFNGGTTKDDLVVKHGGVMRLNVTPSDSNVSIQAYNYYGTTSAPVTIDSASINKAGLMSSLDKQSLESLKIGIGAAVNSIEIGKASGKDCIKYTTVGDNEPSIVELPEKQDVLVSGTNIKTINGTSILGSGNISISSDSGLTTVQTAKLSRSVLHDLVVLKTADNVTLKAPYTDNNGTYHTEESSITQAIPGATIFSAGVMTAADKQRLESLSSNLTIMKMTQSDYDTAKSNGTLNNNILYVITNG